MVISFDSVTAASVGRFLQETQLSEPSRQSASIDKSLRHPQPIDLMDNFASTPQLHLEVYNNSMESGESDLNNNKYKKMLRYVPNEGFHANDTKDQQNGFHSSNGGSVPNTFQHKSHPNAKTKHSIGLSPLPETTQAVESGQIDQNKQRDKNREHHLSKMSSTSLINSLKNLNISEQHQRTTDSHGTPSWMPLGLDEKWEEHSKNKTGNILPPQESLNFLSTDTNTLVHKPQDSNGNAPMTPIWKKMSKEYQSNLVPSHESPLRNIFQTTDDSNETQNVTNSRQNSAKTGHSGFASTSTMSTPLATRDSDIHLTQQQIHQLENMLEEARDQPDDYMIKGSPLKLFGNEYDTFTKAVLSKFVDKVRSNANTIQRQSQPPPIAAEVPVPKLKIKTFTKSGDYTDQDFMKNANNIFAHLQKKGYQGEVLPENLEKPASHQKSTILSRSKTTATSTPKSQKFQPAVGRESSDLYSYSSGTDTFGQHQFVNTTEGINEYTEIDKTNLAPMHLAPSNISNPNEGEDHASYTFDEISEFESSSSARSLESKASRHIGGRTPRLESPSPRSDEVETDEMLPFFENSMASVKKFMKKDSGQKNSSGLQRNSRLSRQPSNANFIKWKRASQLKLLSDFTNKEKVPSRKSSRLVKGTVKPGNFPGQFGNMVFDSEANKWISKDKENGYGGSLDSIEDLVSNENEAPARDIKVNKGGLRDKRNLEVSFQVPDSDSSHTVEEHLHDVTCISEFTNATFSQSNKELVSLITGSTDKIVWDHVTSIDLSDKNIDRVENLEQYLPAVKSINLSKNRLQFVEGLPPTLFELDVTRNTLNDLVSFHKFRDLQVLNASYNSLRSFSSLENNINLTSINLMGNQVQSLDGFPEIHALISLNLGQNNIRGTINLKKLNLPNLKELNLSENMITGIVGIETLGNLRILNVNENRLQTFECEGTHKRLKKLLCKFNGLRELKLEPFPSLRILRIDGNSLVSITGLKKLGYLQELSAKSQSSPGIVEILSSVVADVPCVDFSGNTFFPQILPTISVEAFNNVNQLTLSAVGISVLPEGFSDKFFNVRELNLSFNKLTDLKGLANLKYLRKLQIISNNISKMENILISLQKSRKTLKVLDIRLNIINYEFYPYVFCREELEVAKESRGRIESPIPVHALEDIESFSVHYNALSRSREEWQTRDKEFYTQMQEEGNYCRLKERSDYETILFGFFYNLRELDGGLVPRERRS